MNGNEVSDMLFYSLWTVIQSEIIKDVIYANSRRANNRQFAARARFIAES